MARPSRTSSKSSSQTPAAQGGAAPHSDPSAEPDTKRVATSEKMSPEEIIREAAATQKQDVIAQVLKLDGSEEVRAHLGELDSWLDEATLETACVDALEENQEVYGEGVMKIVEGRLVSARQGQDQEKLVRRIDAVVTLIRTLAKKGMRASPVTSILAELIPGAVAMDFEMDDEEVVIADTEEESEVQAQKVVPGAWTLRVLSAVEEDDEGSGKPDESSGEEKPERSGKAGKSAKPAVSVVLKDQEESSKKSASSEGSDSEASASASSHSSSSPGSMSTSVAPIIFDLRGPEKDLSEEPSRMFEAKDVETLVICGKKSYRNDALVPPDAVAELINPDLNWDAFKSEPRDEDFVVSDTPGDKWSVYVSVCHLTAPLKDNSGRAYGVQIAVNGADVIGQIYLDSKKRIGRIVITMLPSSEFDFDEDGAYSSSEPSDASMHAPGDGADSPGEEVSEDGSDAGDENLGVPDESD